MKQRVIEIENSIKWYSRTLYLAEDRLDGLEYRAKDMTLKNESQRNRH